MTRTAWTFVITAIAVFMAALDNLVVTTALPVIRADFAATLPELEWMVNAYTLTFAVLLLTGAALGDRFGRKRMFIIGLAIFTAGSTAAALSSTSSELIIARAIQGIGGAILTPLSLTILSAAVSPERRAVALGAWGGIAGSRHRHRSPGRWRHRRRPRLAVDLLGQRPDRPRGHPAGVSSGSRKATDRQAVSICPVSASSAPACSRSCGAW